MLKIIRFIIVLSLNVTVVPVLLANTDLKLPSVSKNLKANITPRNLLGTNDQGIGIKKGETVAPFELKTHAGKPTSLYQLLHKAPLLVVFYRGGWCPYCNLQIRQLTDIWPELQKRNITPVLISVDETTGAALAAKTYEIPFPVLSDPDLKAHSAFDVVLDVDEKTYKKYQSFGIALEKWSQRQHHKIAIASVFIVNKKGIVQWAHTSKDYKTRPSAQQLLGIIDKLKSAD